MKIARYTRSFIGLMEMCHDGKWCKWEEVEKEIGNLNRWCNRYRNAYEQLFLEKYNPKIATFKSYLNFILILSIIANIILAAKLDGVL